MKEDYLIPLILIPLIIAVFVFVIDLVDPFDFDVDDKRKKH